MSTIDVTGHKDFITHYINNIIKSSQKIVEEEQILFDFLDEALREAEVDSVEGCGDPEESTDSVITNKLNVDPSTSMEISGDAAGGTEGAVVNPNPLVNGGVNHSKHVEDVAETAEEIGEQTTSDVHQTSTDQDNESSLDDSVVGRKKEIEKYVQEIIKDAQEKVDKEETGVNAASSPEVDSLPEVTDNKKFGSENSNAPAAVLEDKEQKVQTEKDGTQTPTKQNNKEFQSDITAVSKEENDVNDIEDTDDNLLNQKHFIEVNSKDSGRKKGGTGRWSRIRKSMSNLFSCASSNTKEVT